NQRWTLDLLGNWAQLTSDGVDQNRTHNQQNRLETITGGAPVYDGGNAHGNGNLTTDERGNQYVYDAWNRLVQRTAGAIVVGYAYDALGRRTLETTITTTRDLYYSAAWQVLEERVTGQADPVQYVWSTVYVDALVARDRGSERFYAQQDANFNVTALVDRTGQVQERYVYDPYGQPTRRSATWGPPGIDRDWRYLHQGGRYEPTTGLYDSRIRSYS